MKYHICIASIFIFLFLSCNREDSKLGEASPAPQPYELITARETGIAVPESPDPLVAWRWEKPMASDDLEVYTLKPESYRCEDEDAFSNLEAFSKGKAPLKVSGEGELMLDFGQVNSGWLEFDSEDFNGKVELSISEFNEPSVMNTGAQNRIKTMEPVRHGNTYRLELNDELYEGVRFGWIHVREFDEEWHINDIRLVCQIRPTNYEGSFRCDDSELTRIWYTGAYGVKLNLLKDFFGAILMERSDRFSWTGDAHPSQAASLVAFGNQDFVLTNIHHTADQNNGILSYSMYWIQSLTDYYWYSGDTATLIQYIDNAREKLDLAYEHYGTDPSLRYYGWDERLGAGFENHSCRESQNAYMMLCIDSWLAFAEVMETVDRQEIAEQYRGYAEDKIADLRENPQWYSEFGVHAASDAINAGFVSRDEMEAMYGAAFSNRLNRLSYSPFNQYFIIQALATMGRYEEALTSIADCWGGQLDYGATTYFEVYRPSWNLALEPNDAPPNNQCGYTSLCHPWGGGVVPWLSEELLGIKPLKPGFTTFSFKPHPGHLKHISGTVPTPLGDISASMDLEDGWFELEIPEGSKGEIWIPEDGRKIGEIRLNGEVMDTRKEGEHHYAGELGAGSHRLEVDYEGEKELRRTEQLQWPQGPPVEDHLTSGNWEGKYGSDGFVWFAAESSAGGIRDLRKLPAYVNEIISSKQDTLHWEAETEDSRALSRNTESPGSLGAICTGDPRPTYQTMTVDIDMEEGPGRQVALYFVDWDDAGRRLAVEFFDLETSKLLAPVQVVRDFSQGKYLIYDCKGPVRFRINHVRGPNATLSAIFFN